jgi:hypothetical protein
VGGHVAGMGEKCIPSLNKKKMKEGANFMENLSIDERMILTCV